MKDSLPSQTHSYPRELVSFIFDLWRDPQFLERLHAIGIGASFQLPERTLLEHVVSVCYQASLMREETRPVIFRLIICPAELIPNDVGPPTGLHQLKFTRPRLFNEREIYKLAPAADFYRTLIGIHIDREANPKIWGLIHSGTRWMQTVFGGRKMFPSLPFQIVIYVTGPGQISICLGTEIIAALNDGHINHPSPDIFTASWLTESYVKVRHKMLALHEAARSQSKKPWAILDQEFGKHLAQQTVRRIIGTIRNSHHGGMLIYLPMDMRHDFSAENSFISIRYPFHDDESRQRFATLMLRIMNAFAEFCGDPNNPEKVIGWNEYVTCQSEEIALLDEAIFNVADLIATLTATDGAVVMTKQQELLGFGGFVLGDTDRVEMVHRAFDPEGKHTKPELIEMVGTRHRAAYRLCQHLHDAFAVVISQDGDVEFVKWLNGVVTYWKHAPSGVPGF